MYIKGMKYSMIDMSNKIKKASFTVVPRIEKRKRQVKIQP